MPRTPSLPARRHHETMQALKHMHQHQREILEGIQTIMTILEDIKTINAETSEKVHGLSTKLDSAIAKNAGYREAIKALKARIEELIAAGSGGDGIDAAGAAELVTLAQEIEDSTDEATVKADLLANTDEDEDAPPVDPNA